MLPFPSVPTDSLYKFKALGGIFVLLTSLIVLFTEVDKATREQIELHSQIALYKLINKIADEDEAESTHIYKTNSLLIDKERQLLEQRIIIAKRNNEELHYTIDRKLYSPVEYEGVLNNRYDAVVTRHNEGTKKWNNRQDERRKDEIKIKEKTDLIERNTCFLNFIGAVTGGAIVIGLILITSGFKHWKKLQSMSDELAKLQVDKARKDLEGNKPKIILLD